MKWYGVIACMEQVETEPDVYETKPVEHEYFGDVIKSHKSQQSSNVINNNITLGNELSIVYDPYLQSHFYDIAYVTFMGKKWKVSNATIEAPRIILSFGDQYTEDQT